ncbi:MAG: 4-hydroxy-tetrahydrodipicolinate reductase [Spirochaetes bacterium ADurb.Bin218]|jgi:4-hydroxy-tetrahydrodipicolinate reductase|nr:4-hydroxy-tetrahydrodipicolinate reductase [Spirochaetota bacterium]OQB00208.1 MAG: 4-hydroxy-tetrahydrodipicolinate reductase [Spirochaetes bacterium ADurb.Bin218]HOV07739.1 4-hydroxy-tetrahydrodipicolinate reductase [Spirochaetota bacterium]HPX90287.1 4-hydroxy-tetrahydrodipicolinate reductase [Spirochaetota bacterium]HRU65140.1 4-hydroxy-tetrahydrodipicolinate reductase [Spirochaetota bacterium]
MNIGICGISGRMGHAILRIMVERGHRLSAAFDATTSPLIGKNAKEIVNSPLADCQVKAITSEALEGTDCIIDFSAPGATLNLAEILKDKRIPLVIGTTGFTVEEAEKIRQYSQYIPVILSPNMSLGVNLLFKLTEIASKALTIDYDVEIFEAHHRFKKDAPSGTAKRLLEEVRKNMKGLSDAREVDGREGITGERSSNEIGMHALRGGNIIGEHTVFFVGMDDRIELTHRAASRDVFARGAVAAAEFLAGKSAGFYTMYDVLGFK